MPVIRTQRADGTSDVVRLTNTDGRWTAVVSFSEDCRYCVEVAPDWAEWFQSETEVEIVVVTRDGVDRAALYSAAHGWEEPPVTVALGDPARSEGFLVSRTPWLFLFDADGALRYQGPGADLESWREMLPPNDLGQVTDP